MGLISKTVFVPYFERGDNKYKFVPQAALAQLVEQLIRNE